MELKYAVIKLLKGGTQRVPLDREKVDSTKAVLHIGNKIQPKAVEVLVLTKGENIVGPLYWDRVKKAPWLHKLKENKAVVIEEKEGFFDLEEKELKKYFQGISDITVLQKYLPYCVKKKYSTAQKIISTRIKELADGE